MTPPNRILFVCTGNICRSPLAELYLKRLLREKGPGGIEVYSAGIQAMDGNPSPPEAVDTASVIKLDLESHRAQRLTRELVDSADQILVMAPEHAEYIESCHPEAASKIDYLARYGIGLENDTVPDPLGGSAFHYRSTYGAITQAVLNFYNQKIGTLREALPSTGRHAAAPGARSASSSAGKRVSLVVPASAANLGPGFDTLGLALTMYNRLTLEEAERDEVIVEGEGAGLLPEDGTNIAFQAVEVAFQAAGASRPPLRLTLGNAIPLGRGLGSSAAARVGGLVAGRIWCGRPDDPAQLLRQAETLEGHADNAAPSLLGGLTVVAGTGDDLRFSRASISDRIQISLAVPDFEVSTPEARKALPPTVSHANAVFNVQRTALLLAALASGDTRLLPLATQDRLHQPYRSHLMGPLGEVFDTARQAGAAGAALSGAGPTVIALSARGEADPRRIAEAMAAVYRERDIGCRALILQVDLEGVRLEGPGFPRVQ